MYKENSFFIPNSGGIQTHCRSPKQSKIWGIRTPVSAVIEPMLESEIIRRQFVIKTVRQSDMATNNINKQ
jgi:hypothetical protein